MPTNPNMKAIQTVTVGAGGIAEIDFQSIPQTYTDLMLVFSTREESSTSAEIFLKFNNNTSNLQTRWLRGNGSSATSGTTSNMQLLTNSNSALASTFSNAYFYIPNYAGSNNKSAMSDGIVENNVATSPDVFQNMAAYLWSDTAAITRITAYLSTGDIAQYSTATLYGVTSAAVGAKATGGIITSDANYYYHTFLASGTFTPTQSITADMLVVAGGGGSGADRGGGGGAGGLLAYASQSLTATGYTITVGAGGAGGSFTSEGNPSNTKGSNGSNSQFGSLTASTGGGGGGACSTGSNINGANGGSGGGAAFATGSSGSVGTGTSGQGSNGGTGIDGGGAAGGGGGGGATAVGANATSSPKSSGAGGAGSSAYSDWGLATSTGQNVSGTYWYAGGGAGGAAGDLTTTAASGGNGGGGAGSASTTGTAGTANTGGGAGGGFKNAGSAGGSGVLIVRYAK